jgi:DNA-binding CsgD family transcriptional regulator
MLAARAERMPVLVVVDDLQWVDQPSAEVLVFVARRLRAERVAMIVGCRTPVPGSAVGGLLAGLHGMEVANLDVATAHGLLGEQGVARHVTERLFELTGGNPLALLEVAGQLDRGQRKGSSRLPDQLPSTSPEEAYRRTFASFAASPRAAVRLAALAGRAPREVVTRALKKSGLALEDLTPLERSGLGRLGCEGMSWRHPLVRNAAAQGLTTEVRFLHQSLAAAWEGLPGSTAARAWHMARGAAGPDQQAADALAYAAELSEQRGALLEAADAYERAAELAGNRHRRVSWHEAAAHCAFRAGATERAQRLHKLAADTFPPQSAAVLQERGRIAHCLAAPLEAYGLFLAANRVATTSQQRVWTAAESVFSAMYAKRPDLALEAAALAREEHEPDDPVQAFLARHAAGAARALAGDRSGAADLLEPAVRDMLAGGLLEREPALTLWAVNADLFSGRVYPPHREVLAAVDEMRARGELIWTPRVIRLIGIRYEACGHWSEAVAAHEEALELSRAAGQRSQEAEALFVLAWIESVRGQQEECMRHIDEAARIVKGLDIPWLRDNAPRCEGLLHLGLGNFDKAASILSTAFESNRSVRPDLVEALLASGRRPEAEDVGNGSASEDFSQRWAMVYLDKDEESGARRALAMLGEASTAFEAARLRLLAGERLRRAGRRRGAREQLRQAETVFASLGARGWITRVNDELRASGATLRRNTDDEQLTPAELRIATLVAQGRSNKEVASILFLSPKTIEFHLGRIYRKLNVANRTALAAALARSQSAAGR